MTIELLFFLLPALVLYVLALSFGYITGVKQRAELAKIDPPDEPLAFGDAESHPFKTSVDIDEDEDVEE